MICSILQVKMSAAKINLFLLVAFIMEGLKLVFLQVDVDSIFLNQ